MRSATQSCETCGKELRSWMLVDTPKGPLHYCLDEGCYVLWNLQGQPPVRGRDL